MACDERLIPYSLELGGKDRTIGAGSSTCLMTGVPKIDIEKPKPPKKED